MDCDRVFLVFVLVPTGDSNWMVSQRYYEKSSAKYALEVLLKLLPDYVTPQQVKQTRRRLLARIRRYKRLRDHAPWGDSSRSFRSGGTH
ncbi:MAG: hypothetical protein AAB776_01295 [Patescibacteria group bacterium]